MPPYEFSGGVAALTGAASGIGRALAAELAGRGSHLALVDRDREGLEVVAADLRAQYPALRITAHPFDLSDLPAIPELAAEILAGQRRVTLLVNNAGVALGGRFEQLTLEEFEWVQTINFRAVVALTHALLPALRSELGGHLVNLSSLFGLIAPEGQSAYSASKFAVRGFSEVLRHELAPNGLGVTVVHPGGVKTNIARRARLGSGVGADEAREGVAAMNSFLRLSPEAAARQIAQAIGRRTPRLLIGQDARSLDLIVRARPGTYWALVRRLIAVSLPKGP